MDPSIADALSRGGLIDITTLGRRTGVPRRVEIVYHVIDGHIYISGMPGHPRDWLANMVAEPHFTFHLKRGVRADLPAVATPIRGSGATGRDLHRDRQGLDEAERGDDGRRQPPRRGDVPRPGGLSGLESGRPRRLSPTVSSRPG